MSSKYTRNSSNFHFILQKIFCIEIKIQLEMKLRLLNKSVVNYVIWRPNVKEKTGFLIRQISIYKKVSAIKEIRRIGKEVSSFESFYPASGCLGACWRENA